MSDLEKEIRETKFKEYSASEMKKLQKEAGRIVRKYEREMEKYRAEEFQNALRAYLLS